MEATQVILHQFDVTCDPPSSKEKNDYADLFFSHWPIHRLMSPAREESQRCDGCPTEVLLLVLVDSVTLTATWVFGNESSNGYGSWAVAQP